MGTYTVYPDNIDGNSQLPLSTDNVTPVAAEVVNRHREAIIAIEAELGIQPSGTYTTVRARLDALELGGGGGAGGTIGEIRDEGVLIDTNVTSLNFRGANVDAVQTAPGKIDIFVSGAGGGTIFQVQESKTVNFNGQTAFTLSFTPQDDDAVKMYVNGFKQEHGVDYTVTGTAVTYSGTLPLVTSDDVEFWYISDDSTTLVQIIQETIAVTVLGQVNFTLSDSPIDTDAVEMYINGQKQQHGTGNDYTVAGDIATYSGPLTLDVTDVVEFWYITDGVGLGGGGGGGGETLAETLVFGNSTGGTDMVITDGDNILLNHTTTDFNLQFDAAFAGLGRSINITGQQSSTTQAGYINITGGYSTGGNGNGGAVVITGGESDTGNGGGVDISGGVTNDTTGAGGNIDINGGSATVGNTDGGSINITSGFSAGTGQDGHITLTAVETSTTSANHGVINFAGLVSEAPDIYLRFFRDEPAGRQVNVQFDDDATNPIISQLVTGSGGGNTLSIVAQSTTDPGFAPGGDFIITAGDAGGSGNGGSISITSGNPTDGYGGDITITAVDGAGTNANGGNISISSGGGTGAGFNGSITFDLGFGAASPDGEYNFMANSISAMRLRPSAGGGPRLEFNPIAVTNTISVTESANNSATQTIFRGGDSTGAGNNGGVVGILGGDGGTGGNGGLTLVAGGTGSTTGTGGGITISGGNGGSSGSGGDANIIGGTAFGTGLGGDTIINGGKCQTGEAAGDVIITGGAAVAGDPGIAGNVDINAIGGSTNDGNINLDLTTITGDGYIRMRVDGYECLVLDADRVFLVGNAGTVPTVNPVDGGYMYAAGGAGKWRGSSGTVTTFGPADPHCPRCKRDFALEASNESEGWSAAICVPCLVDSLDSAGISRDAYMIYDNLKS